jgi:hypothetical protein
MSVPEAEVDQLYQELSPDQFTATRDALARELRRDGDRAAADEVKRLRKPSVAAWGLNRLSRAHRRSLDRLLAAGERLREAQQQLLEGGDADRLKDAVTEERRLVAELAELAAEGLEETGHAVSPTIRSRLRETLHSAAASAEVRTQLAAGRLEREHQISDLGLVGDGMPSEPSRGRARPVRDAKAKPRAKGPSRREQALRQSLERERTRERELKAELTDADRAARSARSEAERTATAAARAQDRHERAGARVRELEEQLRGLK